MSDRKLYLSESNIYGSSRLGNIVYSSLEITNDAPSATEFMRTLGNKQYELSNHLGNVQAVIADRKVAVEAQTQGQVAYYNPEVLSAVDYYAFGMVMPARHITSANEYRYGYNTQESVDEIAGVKNHYTAPYWEYDPRVVHRWNLDPKPHPSFSPYAINQCNPILYSDPLGDTVKYEKGLKGLNERFQVGVSKLLSKEFRKEFKTLENSQNVYTLHNTKATSGETGGITVDKINKDDDGNITNYEFSLNYSTKEDFRKAPVGKSPLHGLFEETFHAADFEKGRSGMKVLSMGALGWDNQSQRIFGEATAWKFAADNAPFSKNSGYFKSTFEGQTYKVFTNETIIRRIKETNDIGQIGRILFTKQRIPISSPDFEEGATVPFGPIYSR